MRRFKMIYKEINQWDFREALPLSMEACDYLFEYYDDNYSGVEDGYRFDPIAIAMVWTELNPEEIVSTINYDYGHLMDEELSTAEEINDFLNEHTHSVLLENGCLLYDNEF